MKITPLEIRQKTFEKAFRGLDKDEVQAYLTSLSQEWERVLVENKDLTIKLEATEKEVEKLREVENSLFKTLKTVEDTGANMIDQAEKTAKLHLKESQMNADVIINDAQNKARNTIEVADLQARDAINEMEEQLKSLVHSYRTLESYRDDLISGLKVMANEVLEKSNRAISQVNPFNLEDEIKKAKNIVQTYKFKDDSPKKKSNTIQNNNIEPPEKEQQTSNKENSFFDDID